MTKKRIMRDFRIHEISAVDFPAQEMARATLLKRAGQKEPDMHEPQSFDEAVAKLRKSDATLKSAAARTLARQQFPHLVQKMQREADRMVAQAHQRPVAKASVTNFLSLVAGHQRATGCTRTEALSEIRKRHPREFAALQEA